MNKGVKTSDFYFSSDSEFSRILHELVPEYTAIYMKEDPVAKIIEYQYPWYDEKERYLLPKSYGPKLLAHEKPQAFLLLREKTFNDIQSIFIQMPV